MVFTLEAETGRDDALVALVAGLRVVLAGELTTLSLHELRAVSTGLRSVRSWVDASSARVTAAISTVGGAAAGSADVRESNVSGREQRRRRDVAAAVTNAPVFVKALETGAVTPDHVAALAKLRNKTAVPDAQHGLLHQAMGTSPEEFVRRLSAWDDALDADAGASADRRRWAKRRLMFGTGDDGMGTTNVLLPPVEHAILQTLIAQIGEQLWRRGERDTTIAQRNADALLELLKRANHEATEPVAAPSSIAEPVGAPAPSTSPPKTRRPNRPPTAHPTLIVLIDENSLLGRLDHAGISRTTNGAPITPSEARRLACNANIIPVVLNGKGRVIDIGRTQRLVTTAQWWALIARDKGCATKGCTIPAEHCEAHHITPWDNGGPTTLDNLTLLCSPHHRQHHHHTPATDP